MDLGSIDKLYGNYRAKVIENRDTEKFGRVLVWIPDIMPSIPDNQGIWARPANNPIGGRNEQFGNDNHYAGSCYIPKKGSYIFIFFESGNINKPYYFGALDLENTKVLPENQVGTNFQDKWTIFKSHEGRTIVISDDSDDKRVEITGKKRKLKSPPSGNIESVYTIDGNQTTILFDERSGKEKILIRTHKGDFLHIDIDERKLQAQFESDIIIKTNGKFQLTALSDIDIKSKNGDIHIQSDIGSIDNKATNQINIESTNDTNIKSGGLMSLESAGNLSEKAGGTITSDGTMRNDQEGLSISAGSAANAIEADPKGERET